MSGTTLLSCFLCFFSSLDEFLGTLEKGLLLFIGEFSKGLLDFFEISLSSSIESFSSFVEVEASSFGSIPGLLLEAFEITGNEIELAGKVTNGFNEFLSCCLCSLLSKFKFLRGIISLSASLGSAGDLLKSFLDFFFRCTSFGTNIPEEFDGLTKRSAVSATLLECITNFFDIIL